MTKRRAVAVAVLPSVFAFVVYLWALGVPALWLDEAATASEVGRSLGGLLGFLAHRDAGLGAYYLAMSAWTSVGDAEWWLRLPSAAAMAVAAGVIADLARRWWGVSSGITAGVLTALSPMASRYAQEARPYALVVAVGVLSVWLLLRAVRTDRWRWWAVYAAALTLHAGRRTTEPAHRAAAGVGSRSAPAAVRRRSHHTGVPSAVPAHLGARARPSRRGRAAAPDGLDGRGRGRCGCSGGMGSPGEDACARRSWTGPARGRTSRCGRLPYRRCGVRNPHDRSHSSVLPARLRLRPTWVAGGLPPGVRRVWIVVPRWQGGKPSGVTGLRHVRTTSVAGARVMLWERPRR
ncbi:glycosyltransferase family 39 protein [Actinopolymorpha sp. B11F2]|uniref:glycosyltransferase family 39 protein n=1 Tax=Actinopolymorpha sp. B11F2 TaxID=3160862 RepID=UPI0032E4CB80